MNTKEEILSKHFHVDDSGINNAVYAAMQEYAESYHSHQSVSGAQVLPTDLELDVLCNSILAADPRCEDVVINDLRAQIVNITKKVRKFKALSHPVSSSVSDAVEFAEWLQLWVRAEHGLYSKWNEGAGKHYTLNELYTLFLNRPEPPKK